MQRLPQKQKISNNKRMGWEELIDALDELETEVEYDGYFCSIKDAVIIVTLGSMCELKSVMRIHSWATTGTVSKFLAESFGIKRIPCYGWLLELLALIKPDSLNCCMMKFVASLCPELLAELEKEQEKQAAKKKRPVTVSLDGKTMRSTAKIIRFLGVTISNSPLKNLCLKKPVRGVARCPRREGTPCAELVFFTPVKIFVCIF